MSLYSNVPVILSPTPSADINLCIICQKTKRNEKTSSTGNRREKVIKALNDSNDKRLVTLSSDDLENIKYHTNTCYKSYVLKANRLANKKCLEPCSEDLNEDNNISNEIDLTPRIKRRKIQRTRMSALFVKTNRIKGIITYIEFVRKIERIL